MVVGDGKSGEEEARESSRPVAATGVNTLVGHPVARGGVLVRGEFRRPNPVSMGRAFEGDKVFGIHAAWSCCLGQGRVRSAG